MYANVYLNPNGGNVGIGSATAVKLLHLQKDQNADTALLIRNLSSGTTAMSALDVEGEANGIQLITYSTTAAGNWGGNTVSRTNTAALRTYTTLPVSSMLVGTGSPSPLHLMTSDVPRMTVGSTGNVGIGTTTPNYQVDIQGTTAAFSQLRAIASPAGPDIYLNKDRGAVGSPAIIQNGDAL